MNQDTFYLLNKDGKWSYFIGNIPNTADYDFSGTYDIKEEDDRHQVIRNGNNLVEKLNRDNIVIKEFKGHLPIILTTEGELRWMKITI